MSGAMAHEEDAEVYNWGLLQEDRERELRGDRTHSTGDRTHSTGDRTHSTGDHVQEPRTIYNSRDTVQAFNSRGHRPLSGYIRFAKYNKYE